MSAPCFRLLDWRASWGLWSSLSSHLLPAPSPRSGGEKVLLSSPVLLVVVAMAPHSSTLAWKIPWTEEPGGLQSMGSRRVGHDWATSLLLFTFMHWRRKWQPTPVFLPGESQGRGAWWAAVYGVTQSRTWLKRLSSSSSSSMEKQRPLEKQRPWRMRENFLRGLGEWGKTFSRKWSS